LKTKKGGVDSRAKSEQAENTARRTSEVKSVKNDLKVKSTTP
jgi:osmotically-inducible protein OsmY